MDCLAVHSRLITFSGTFLYGPEHQREQDPVDLCRHHSTGVIDRLLLEGLSGVLRRR